ncbi:spore germination protein PC [Paenibacillus endophyticus]|uniref:Spore germination protein PC n=1 Tax=Paenibacillus endophyticus TaxID=1294268 RepID=A0A7W5GDV1_9BACL|nr:spore germination protein GerPC [Paenibacillus endophyticus]MBB3156281.1 spore germination protein PC [Paenibacillus endophyticus]
MQQPNPLSPWQMWSLEVQNKLKEQQEQLEALSAKVLDLCEQIKHLEARPTYNIESIEYHFDQLKVDKLDGTLNIGMTAPGMGDETFPGSIEQLAVSKPEVFPSAGPTIPDPSPVYNEVFNEMTRYLDAGAPQTLLAYENQFGIPLDPYHRKIIIEDVRKQVPTRIHFYMQKKEKGAEAKQAAEDSPASAADVLAKTRRDADAALYAYMRQLQTGSPSSGGMA